ncbi:tRNA-splicing endonuclease subunit Sen2 [Culex pipiens pallens]|uniref:tRNA-splicing endonuclease subunit Sen2 n=1 Tax=Culex pipiens pallens TaxID=42434 RepID=UPI0019533599|nr:tRNA-splicing endonuclease subunit Sen2 [Culex pipiens pallens]
MNHALRPVPKPKKFTPPVLTNVDPLPTGPVAIGLFTGLSVEVCDPAAMAHLSLDGGFGQGTSSRSFPKVVARTGRNVGRVRRNPSGVVHRRQVERRREWAGKFGSVEGSGETVWVMEEDEEKLVEVGAVSVEELKRNALKVEEDPFMIRENLSLSLEEAMFLVRELDVLKVQSFDGSVFTEKNLVEKFAAIKKDFIPSYAAFMYLKSRNWIIRSGLKFGGDFLLYQKGPQFFHASYIVLIQTYQSGKILTTSGRNLENYDFQCFNRIAETTAKDLLILEVHYPEGLDPADPHECLRRLNEFRVGEVFPKHHNYVATRTG